MNKIESTATKTCVQPVCQVQKKKKRKGKKAEPNQRGSTDEDAGKTSSSGKKTKRGKVKHQAEFVVG